jgi:hypothetical protein
MAGRLAASRGSRIALLESLGASMSREGTRSGPTYRAALPSDARRWMWQRRTGYPSIRERRAALARVMDGKKPLLDQWRRFLVRG